MAGRLIRLAVVFFMGVVTVRAVMDLLQGRRLDLVAVAMRMFTKDGPALIMFTLTLLVALQWAFERRTVVR